MTYGLPFPGCQRFHEPRYRGSLLAELGFDLPLSNRIQVSGLRQGLTVVEQVPLVP